MKFGKRFSLLAALTVATAVFPVLGARAQDKSGCSLAASDCALIAAAETNIAKETSFTQDFEFDTITSVGPQKASLQVSGKGPLSHDAASTDFLNAYQVQLDLSGARTGSGNDTKGTIGLVLTGGALYFKTNTVPWTGVKVTDIMSLIGTAGGTSGVGNMVSSLAGGLDPNQIISLLRFPSTFSAILASPNSKDYLKQAKTANTPTLENQPMTEFIYGFDLKNIQDANALTVVRSLLGLGGTVMGSTASMSDKQFQAFLTLASPDSTLTVTRWVGQTDSEYHALGLDLKLGFTPQAGATGGGAVLSVTTHFLVKLTQVGQPVTIKPPDGAKMVDLQQLMGVFGGMMGGAGGGQIPPGSPVAPQATATK